MRAGRWLLGLGAIAPVAVLIASCDKNTAAVGLVMRAPQGVLDSAVKVELSVFDAKRATCFTTGHVDPSIPTGEGVQTFALESSGCDPGVKWCKEIELDKDDSTKMFAVVASSAVGIVAEGCAIAKIDQDPLEVTIQVKRYNPPPCCNDGVFQVGEQCEGAPATFNCFTGEAAPPGGVTGQCLGIERTETCDCNCVALENALDRPLGGPPPPQGTRRELSMTFAPGAGVLDQGLRAAFTNTVGGPGNTSDVEIRAMTKDMLSIFDLPALSGPLKIPLRCSPPPPQDGTILNQRSPSIAAVTATSSVVAYLSDEAQGGTFGVYVSHQNDSGCADAAPLRVDTSTSQTAEGPDVAAGPGNSALVTWTAGGQVRGRIWTVSPTGAVTITPPANEIVVAPNATRARVAGTEQGWIVAYSGSGPGDGDGIFVVRVDPNGVPTQPILVNGITTGPQDLPDVAALEDGRSCVVWHSGGDVFFQRFGADGTPNPNDQASSIHLVQDGATTIQTSPAIAASVGFGDFFVVAWEYVDLGIIAARYVGGSEGFLYNTVTGQNDDWAASHLGIPGARRSPAVAVGGGGYVAIGWHDESLEHAGVWVRRFPLPTE